MRNRFLFLIAAGWIAAALGGCSFFYVENREPSIQAVPEEIAKENLGSSAAGDSAELLGSSAVSQEAEAAEDTKGETSTEELNTGSGFVSSGERESWENAEEKEEKEVQSCLDGMSLEDKIAQLFIIYPEMLVPDVNQVTAAGEKTREALSRRPVCGLIYMRQNLKSKEQVQAMLSNFQQFSLERIGLPAFLCVDEEGGTVTSVGGTKSLGIPRVEDMAAVGRRNRPEEAYQMGEFIGSYLSELGFNVDFAPVADVLSNSENQVVKKRSFGSDPEVVTAMAAAFADGLKSRGILSTYKHFPGHGATAGDTHKGYSCTDKTLEELNECELLPFADGAEREVPLMMIGHISLPEVVGDNTPASLSPFIVNTLLREKLGYDGIVITDALAMGAVIQEYTSDAAAVKALEAGADILLLPEDFELAYQGVLKAVNEGRLSEERIDQSLRRIIRQKLRLNERMQAAGQQGLRNQELTDQELSNQGEPEEEISAAEP